jgi:GNAT superfamily N-acetyltransferase
MQKREVVKLILRDYKEEDWARARLIHDLARPIELEGSCDERAFVPLADDKDDLKQFQSCRKLVACLEKRVIGFIGIQEDEIGWLYVDPSESGQGVGRQLLQKGLDAINSIATVHVLDGNKRALNLYLSEDFKVVHSFKSENNGYPCTVVKLMRKAIS